MPRTEKHKLKLELKLERQRDLPLLVAAAQRVLNKGWHLFPLPYKCKVPFFGSHSYYDALPKQFSERALRKWIGDSRTDAEPCNPAIYLERSGKTVLDIDEGLTSVNHAIEWAKKWNLPMTYMVVTGRATFGIQFYFDGVRTLPDIFQKDEDGHALVTFGDGVYGDLKCKGYVLAEGAIHDKTGATYYSPNPDEPCAKLPDILRDYKIRKAVNLDKNGDPASAGIVTDGVLKVGDIDGNLVVKSQRYRFLGEEAGKMRSQGLTADQIYANLKQTCLQYCEDGEQYAKDQDGVFRRRADSLGAQGIFRRLNPQWTTKLPLGKTQGKTPNAKLGTGMATGVIVRLIPRAAPVTVLVRRLRELYPVGAVTTVATMLSTYPELKAYKHTLFNRAVKSAGFHKIGRGTGPRVKWEMAVLP